MKKRDAQNLWEENEEALKSVFPHTAHLSLQFSLTELSISPLSCVVFMTVGVACVPVVSLIYPTTVVMVRSEDETKGYDGCEI